ncbi:MAG TPA: sulfite oxidase [Amycolatopsis sp.]|uniref:sulfite oxidase n=1 Tax=Amycolatopsis sp. TaxID=37632 RepID=UPI002B464A7E|nr:sulfite oxidase [Amycolatopsis sp.]HKS46323.1 sulfite oxidase [Amycolatopsis sp.]
MNTQLRGVSLPARVAASTEEVGFDELALAARNHGMPLEALRYDLTPPGLHYTLIHYDIPQPDIRNWRLSVTGRVKEPATFSLDELRTMPSRTVRVTMECAGNGRALLRPRPVSQPWLVEAVGTAEWTGVPLRAVLAECGIGHDVIEAVFTGADHGVERGVEQDYRRGLALDEARREEVLLAYQMNGAPLPPQHGYPLRLIVPGWYGMAQVKWLREIELVNSPFTGFQNTVAYRARRRPDEPGEPVTRIAVRALINPPGMPDFMSRTRIVRPGPLRLAGRAWSGRAPVTRVDVSTDGCRTWAEADLDIATGHVWAWREWIFDWEATPGDHVLAARATDADGNTQPVHQAWNRGGFANNLVHRVHVACLP